VEAAAALRLGELEPAEWPVDDRGRGDGDPHGAVGLVVVAEQALL